MKNDEILSHPGFSDATSLKMVTSVFQKWITQIDIYVANITSYTYR